MRSPQKAEQEFWETMRKSGDQADLKYARDLPDDTPDFILKALAQFEEEVSEFCFDGASGLVLDAGCGNGDLLMRSRERLEETRYVGLDFSRNMLTRAVSRARGRDASFLRGSVTGLPFEDATFDRVVSSGVLTCLPSVGDARSALEEFSRVLKPGGTLVVDFFNCASHFTRVRKHILGEVIEPPEYMSPGFFRTEIEGAGFRITGYRGFDFKLYQGYLFMSRWRPLIDPGFLQERVSRVVESRIVPRLPALGLLGYRIYVKAEKV